MPKKKLSAVKTLLFEISFLTLSISAVASDKPMSVRGHNSFTRVFGMPMYPSITKLEADEWDASYALNMLNHADSGDSQLETIFYDGESYLSNFMVTYALSESWQLGGDLPYVQYSSGFMDGFIEGWHDVFGLSNSNRMGPRDELKILYINDQETLYNIVDNNSGIGDVRLWSSYTFSKSENTRVSLRGTLKLATGDSDNLHGSGGTDFAVDISAIHHLLRGNSRWSLSGFAGVLLPGDGDVLSDMQTDVVTYGGVGTVWEFNAHLNFLAQAQFQSSYFDSDRDELGGQGVQVSVGARYLWPESNMEFIFGIHEDVVSDTTPDFGFHFELLKTFK